MSITYSLGLAELALTGPDCFHLHRLIDDVPTLGTPHGNELQHAVWPGVAAVSLIVCRAVRWVGRCSAEPLAVVFVVLVEADTVVYNDGTLPCLQLASTRSGFTGASTVCRSRIMDVHLAIDFSFVACLAHSSPSKMQEAPMHTHTHTHTHTRTRAHMHTT